MGRGRPLRWIVAAGVVAVLLVLGAAASFDLDGYRGRIADRVEAATGYHPALGGALRLRLLPSPSVYATDVALTDAPAGTPLHGLRLARLEAGFALLPLLWGEFRVDRLHVWDARVQLAPGRDGGPGRRLDLARLLFEDGTGGTARLQAEGRLDGRAVRLRGEVDSTSRFRSGRPTAVRLEGAYGTGRFDAEGELRLARRNSRPLVEGRLHSERVVVPAVEGAAVGPRLFGDGPLPVTGLGALELALAVQIDELHVGRLVAGPVATEVALSGGRLRLEPLRVGLAGGRLEGGIRVNAVAGPPAIAMVLGGEGLALGELLRAAVGSDALSGPATLRVDVRGRGLSPAAVMGSLEGEARLLVGEGYARLGRVDEMVGGLRRLLGMLTSSGLERARLNCLAADFTIAEGVARSRVLLADTEDSTLYGEGRIDLGRERFDLLLRPKAKSATLNVAVPLRVAGHLTRPTFTPEKIGVARKVLGVLGAVGALSFPPVAILGLVELGGEENPCVGIARAGG